MRKNSLLPVLVTFGVAGAACVGAATLTVAQIEDRSVRVVREILAAEDLDWAEVEADGLQIDLRGTAPDEAERFRALTLAGQVVDGARVIDRMDVTTRDPIEAPRFTVELLRSDEGVSLIGLVPAEMDRLAFLEDIARNAVNTPITDLLQAAAFPAPENWNEALRFGVEAFALADKSKISIASDRVAVTTMAGDAEARANMERSLTRLAPGGVEVALDISIPRPVITPFLFRLSREEGTARLEACSAATETGRDQIIAAVQGLGIDDPICQLGLGVPSVAWPGAVSQAIEAMDEIETGTLTVTDLEIRLESGPATEDFGTHAAALRNDLPEEFTLTALQEDAAAVEPEAGPAEFTATRSPEGMVQIRGRAGDTLARSAVGSYGRALFGTEQVSLSLEQTQEVPAGWNPRLLAAMDALSLLNNGAVRVTPERISVSGVSGSEDASSQISRLFTGRLGDDAAYDVDVRYDERFDVELGLPSPEECVAQVNNILSTRQITFDPGSATIDPESRASVDAIAEILRKCDNIPMEVGGYTDSQGREEMNRDLSQQRAEAVLGALLARRVPVGDLVANGYGEENPIADNDTAEGREANRRIEFALLRPQEDTENTEAAEVEPAE
ncbi:OmpA family protein [Palleronia abyssalis]|uniref:Putative lipoprotein YiaD n=1 Tax=Palleronia abyssalis TaxID=1501240 RepID=A0A2R8BS70_9RHOB|nr:OmpA family protein [Palleronia abyssalis]SPJ22955.1 putative lipoprotein YiaD [Palleronia abyssalis]